MAAGQGFKTFTTGEVLTAGDVNGYLMQGINVFASNAARDAAITSPQEGQFAYTKDTNSLWYYTGSAWAASGATGDIEGVTAGVGISGGGTSGTVTITNSMATEIAAKGDLIVGTGSQTFDNLTVGANNSVLTADSSTATGLKWATPAGGGKVLQVVNVVNNTFATNSTTTYADTNLTATITPTSASSKVLILVTQDIGKSNTNSTINLKLLRGSTNLIGTQAVELGLYTGTLMEMYSFCYSMNYLDSPATTSATTYKTQFAVRAGGTGAVFIAGQGSYSTMTLLEIGA